LIAIYADPALLALPNGLADSSDELATLIDRVIELSIWARDCGAFTIVKPDNLEDLLVGAGAFPTFSIVKETLDAGDLSDTFDTRDVLLSLLAIMERAHGAAEAFGVDVSRSDVSGPTLTPLFDRFPVAVRSMSINALASICLLKSTGRLKADAFAVSGHPKLGRQTLPFEAVVEELSTSEDLTFDLPVRISGSVEVLSSPKDVLHTGRAVSLWCAAQDAAEIHAAVEARVHELVAPDEAAGARSRFSIGSEFVRSLKENQAFSDGKFASTVLETCARIAAGTPKYDINDFGVRSNDGALGKRTHATKHRPALRLLFWMHCDGEVEFANIGQKNDLDIEAGDPELRVSTIYPV
jgi:hypothetical protein